MIARKLWIVIAGVLIFAAAIIGVGAAVINIDMYKGFIVSKIESMTGNHVEIGHISMAWSGRPLISVEDFKMYRGSGGKSAAPYVIACNIEAKIKSIPLFGLAQFTADISVTDGSLTIPLLKAPVNGMSLSASFGGDSVTVNSFSARIAGGSINGSGRCDGIFTSPKTTIRTIIEVQGIKFFVLSVFGYRQNMDGNARLTFDGAMTGSSWPEISKTLAGGGEFYLDRGMVMNTNVLSQTLGSLTLFPGLSDMVKEYVPAPIQEAFRNNDTIIEPLRQLYTIENGYVMIPDLNLRTDTFDVRGEAKSSLTGDVSGGGVMTFAQSVSEAIIKAVPEMKYVTDKQGMVEFPMAFKAGENGFKIIPDMKYVGKRIAVQKAGDMVTDLFQKAAGNGADQGSGQNPLGGSGKPPKLKDIIKNYMDMD